MRIGNILVVVLGVAGMAVGLAATVRWWRLPAYAVGERTDPSGRSTAAPDALRRVAVVASAGLLAGVGVAGLGGRFVMRVLAATSGDAAQGRVTEAGEVVGRITGEGSVGFVVFVGLFGGALAAAGYLLVRRWLPVAAGPAGLLLGLVLLGTIGVLDPLSPDNVDFRLLRPTWLAVVLVAGTGLLTGTTLTTFAARLEALSLAPGRLRYLPYAGLLLAALPSPLLVVAAAHVIGPIAWPRWPGRAGRRALDGAARAATVVLVLATAGTTLIAVVSILTR